MITRRRSNDLFVPAKQSGARSKGKWPLLRVPATLGPARDVRQVVRHQLVLGRQSAGNPGYACSIRAAFAVICKHLDHATFGDPAPGARGDHALQLRLQDDEGVDAPLDVVEPCARDAVGGRA